MITGASTGIGRILAETLAQKGFQIIATVRKEQDAESLQSVSAAIHPILMDVAESDSIAMALPEVAVLLAGQPLYALINNAGIGVVGPVEMIAREALRKQFEVNVFGLIETTQTFLPLMATQGKVIQISSVAGQTTIPFAGAYSASKHAVEALSDALRREWQVVGKKLELVVVQPGTIETPIWEKTQTSFDPETYQGTSYEALGNFMLKRTQNAEGKRARPESVAQAVLEILTRQNNPPRVVVSGQPLQEVVVPRLLPDRVFDRVIHKLFQGK